MIGEPAVVVPSSMRMHTQLLPHLIERNPSLAQEVINALNRLDRSRNVLYQSILGHVRKYPVAL